MRDYRKLKAFQLADELVMAIYRETLDFPKAEQFGLTSQLRRAAVSIATNLVEGSARSSQVEYTRFIEISLGSCWEVRYQLSIARRLDYLSNAKATAIEKNADDTAKVLGALLNSLRKRSTNE